MATPIEVHHTLLGRLLSLAHISEDERRGWEAQMSQANEAIINPPPPKTTEEIEADRLREERRKELQAQLDAL